MIDEKCKSCFTKIVKYVCQESQLVKSRIARLRKKQRCSQAQLAETAHVTRQTINAIENDKYDPSLGLAFHLAQILRVTVDELFLYEGEN